MHTNRLAGEKSPYLLQHAHNPVDWFPWGEEAFAKARQEEKPIFLSIGYSTCHWCHVMERESFESEEIGAVLNRSFVSIKLDREERPDVDRVYMTFVQATTGSGGWPMSVWLTPDLKPFYGGTYFPPDNRYGRPGFRSVLEQIALAWATDRARVERSSEGVLAELRKLTTAPAGGAPAQAAVREATFLAFRRIYDPKLGGFGGAPKFPRPVVLNFLLREWAWSKAEGGENEEALEMALKTLREMARGGMYDHIGGGFHRYSVDARWFVPHFEKMLYDQAQLAIAYLEAFQITGDAAFADVARDIFRYVQRDLRDRDGGFYSAEDADSAPDPARPREKSEGAFYLWTREELDQLLGEDGEWFARRYGVLKDGNVFENDPHGEFTGRNILWLDRDFDQTGGSPADLERVRAVLLDVRARRPRPHLDDKVLTAWNALMISAFAKGAQVLASEEYRAAARASADFIRTHMITEDGILLRRWRDGDAAIPGFLDDYAFYIQALLDLHETEFLASDLDLAARLAESMLVLFEDSASGGFFSTVEGDERLVLRMKEDYDGAEPSGNSIAILALLRLAQMIDGDRAVRFRQAAERALQAFASRLNQGGATVPQMVIALAASQKQAQQVVITGSAAEAGPLVGAAHRAFSPFRVLLLNPDRPGFGANGKAAAYVCQNFQCDLPVTTAEELSRRLAMGT